MREYRIFETAGGKPELVGTTTDRRIARKTARRGGGLRIETRQRAAGKGEPGGGRQPERNTQTETARTGGEPALVHAQDCRRLPENPEERAALCGATAPRESVTRAEMHHVTCRPCLTAVKDSGSPWAWAAEAALAGAEEKAGDGDGGAPGTPKNGDEPDDPTHAEARE